MVTFICCGCVWVGTCLSSLLMFGELITVFWCGRAYCDPVFLWLSSLVLFDLWLMLLYRGFVVLGLGLLAGVVCGCFGL